MFSPNPGHFPHNPAAPFFPPHHHWTEAQPEREQDFQFRNPYWPYFVQSHEYGPRRRFPAEPPFVEHRPNDGWWQGNHKKRGFKPKLFFTRPHDGKRPGAMGRLKDALTGEGADVFVTASGDKRSFLRDRPEKWQWSGWGRTAAEDMDLQFDKDYRGYDEPFEQAPWAANARGAKPFYNFRTRKFEGPSSKWFRPGQIWADAQWPPGAKRHGQPLAWRDWQHERPWIGNKVPWDAGEFAGGRPRVDVDDEFLGAPLRADEEPGMNRDRRGWEM